MKKLPLCKVKIAFETFRKGQLIRPPASRRTWMIAKRWIEIVPEGTKADPPGFPAMPQSVKNAMTKKQRAKFGQAPEPSPKKASPASVPKPKTAVASTPAPKPEPETVTTGDESTVSKTVEADNSGTGKPKDEKPFFRKPKKD